MTVSSNVTTYLNAVNSKDLDFQTALVAPKSPGGLKFYRCDIVFGAADNYVTGGVTISADPEGIQQDSYLLVIVESVTGLSAQSTLKAQYNRANGKIQFFVAAPSPSSAVALTELAGGSTLTQGITVSLLVIEI